MPEMRPRKRRVQIFLHSKQKVESELREKYRIEMYLISVSEFDVSRDVWIPNESYFLKRDH